MPIEIADRLLELKQIWTHEDVEETELSLEMDCNRVQFHCKIWKTFKQKPGDSLEIEKSPLEEFV